jgi:hypothetical protein
MHEPIKIIRFDESNKNLEALRGQWGQLGDQKFSLTMLKNILFVNLYKGCSVDIKLPSVYDGFLITSRGRRIDIENSRLKAELSQDESAFGQLVLIRWN